jgi:hypothetical protein
MNPLFLLLTLWYFITDRGVLASIFNGFLAAITPQLIISLILGLPGAVYVCLKIYKEFIKKDKVHPELSEKLKEKARKAALKTQNGKPDLNDFRNEQDME